MLGVFVDVTARKRAEAALRLSEEQRRQTQKMEALGQLAGGIAHDFNNVLQAVSSGATLIERRADDVAVVRRFVRLIDEAAGRGAATTRRLLAFARRSELRSGSVPPEELLRDLQEILTHTLGSSITVLIDADPAARPLRADRGELETVLVNLATNARDAMPDGGILSLSAVEDAVSPEQPHESGLPVGRYVRLAVADTGIGMDAETVARATEPFFTTKPLGKGTGLGLSMARGFAHQSGGTLLIDSGPGQGTTVTLWLPVADMAEMDAVSGIPAMRAQPDSRLTILLVDDDPLVREVLARDLIEQGYQVAPAETANAALALLDVGDPVDLLVTDLSMPVMDGVTLVQEAKRRRPDLPAIIVTGYAGEAASLAMSGAVSGSFTLLRKPVTGVQIADRAALLLESKSTSRQEGGATPA